MISRLWEDLRRGSRERSFRDFFSRERRVSLRLYPERMREREILIDFATARIVQHFEQPKARRQLPQ